jgi:ABC-type amino acid transport substrate-binding protein
MAFISGCSSGQVQAKKTPYVIAYPKNWGQIQLYGSDQNISGFTSDLLYDIAQAGHFQIQLVMADTGSFQFLLENNSVDAVVTSLPEDSITKKIYDFSTPYFTTGTAIVVSVNSPFEKPQDLVNARVGYDTEEGLGAIEGSNLAWQMVPYGNPAQALDDLSSGKIDGMLINLLNANRLIKNLYRSKVKVLLPPIITRYIRLAVLKGKNKELLTLFNKGAEQYVKSGEYEELLRYWGLESQIQVEKYKNRTKFIPYR